MDLLQQFLDQVGSLQHVWMPVAIFIAIVALLIWRGLVWHYHERVEGYEQRIKLRDDKISFLERGRTDASGHILESPAETRSKPAPREPELSLNAAPDQRVHVPEGVDADYLTGLCRENTSVQAHKLVEPYLGKWIRVEGAVKDVMILGTGRLAVLMQPDGSEEIAGISVWLTFNNDSERVALLRRGDSVAAEGSIQKVDAYTLDLDPADLLKPL